MKIFLLFIPLKLWVTVARHNFNCMVCLGALTCHILNSSPHSPLRDCYKSLIHFDRSGKVNWVSHVKQLLCSIGLQDTWREQRIENSKRFMNDIEITIKNDYINIWRQATTCAPKLRTYITFKKSFNIKHYLLFLPNIKDITAMAKLRLSSHCLRIETGRHKNLPIKDRICLRCESEISWWSSLFNNVPIF